VNKRRPDLETMRRESQWATWQVDRSWLHRRPVPARVATVVDSGSGPGGLPRVVIAALFVALGIVGAGLLTVGIETGIL